MDAPGTESRREIEFTLNVHGTMSTFRDAVSGPSGSIYLAGSVAALGVGPASTNEGLEPALEICQWDGILGPTPCSDGFVAKFTTAGELAWISYFHGVHGEVVSRLKLDSKENIYVAGGTDSNDFPVTAGALQTSYAGPTPPFPTTVSSQDVSGDISWPGSIRLTGDWYSRRFWAAPKRNGPPNFAWMPPETLTYLVRAHPARR